MTRLKDKPSKQYVEILRAIAELPLNDSVPLTAEAMIQILEPLMEGAGYRRAGGRLCAARLLGAQCSEYNQDQKEHPHEPPHVDHPSLWLKDGKPHIYVSQPYGLSWEDLRALVLWCGRWGLRAAVHAESWHYPGRTVAVMITRAREDV